MTGFTVKNLSIVDMAQELADILLAEDPVNFTDVPSGFGERCVIYEPESLYIHFKPDWAASLYFGFVGIRINVSDGWDEVLYTPTGTIYSMFLAPTAHAAYNVDPVYLDSTDERDYWWNKKLRCMYYSDAQGIQLWWNNPFNTNIYDSRTIFFNLEIIPQSYREVVDSHSDIFMNAVSYGTGFNASDDENYGIDNLRAFQVNSTTSMYTYDTRAYQAGDPSILYIDFPWYFSDPGTYLNPLYRTNRWFVLSQYDTDLVPNDIVTWTDGETERSFVIVDMQTGTEAAGDYFLAIPYENAKEYV